MKKLSCWTLCCWVEKTIFVSVNLLSYEYKTIDFIFM